MDSYGKINVGTPCVCIKRNIISSVVGGRFCPHVELTFEYQNGDRYNMIVPRWEIDDYGVTVEPNVKGAWTVVEGDVCIIGMSQTEYYINRYNPFEKW